MMDVIRYKISEHLNADDCLSLSLMNKTYYKALREKVREKKKWEVISNIFPPVLLDIIGKERFLKGKYVKWQDEWLGGTDYIDRISSDELDNNLCYGIDCYRRFFIFIKIKKIFQSLPRTDNGQQEIYTVLTIFKRYSDASSIVCNDNYYNNPLIDSYPTVSGTQIQLLKNFMNTGYFIREGSYFSATPFKYAKFLVTIGTFKSMLSYFCMAYKKINPITKLAIVVPCPI